MTALFLKLHRWLALAFSIPLLVVIATGLVLSVEPWLQTTMAPGAALTPELATKPDQPGTNARLTIDAGLQEYAARRLGTQSGSVVVIDVATGEMLAMVSMPAYDPNSFSDGISHLEWKMLSDNDHVPLMNKVTQGL